MTQISDGCNISALTNYSGLSCGLVNWSYLRPGDLVCITVQNDASGFGEPWKSFMASGGPLPDSSFPGFAVCWKNASPTPRAWLGTSPNGSSLVTIGGGTCNGVGCGEFGGNEVPLVQSYDSGTNSWSSNAALPTARFGLAAVAANNLIYAVGGTLGSSSIPLSTVEAYDPGANSWSTKTSMPTPRWKLTATAVNGIIYAIGGGAGGNQCSPTATVEAYDSTADNWSSKTPMPTPRWGAASDVLNGQVYAVGGSQQCPHIIVTPSAALEIYTPTTDTWTSATSMPTARWDLAAVAANGRLYAIGGWDPIAQKVLSTVEAYDPVASSWSTKAPMPTARTGLAAVNVNGKIYAFGGNDGSKVLGIIEIYDPSTDTWTTPPPPGLPVTHTLTVTSTNPSNGVPITASPSDNSGLGGGTTPFTLSYNSGVVVTLTATPTASANNFSSWSGCDPTSVPPGCTVTMNTDRTVTANYMTPPPKITSISPLSGNQGQTLKVVVSGSNFQAGATLAFRGSGITVPALTGTCLTAMDTNCVSPDGTKAVATITVAPDAPIDLKDLAAANPGSQLSPVIKNAFRVDREFPIFTGPAGEPTLAVDPKHPSHLVVGFNDASITPHRCGWAETTNGGDNWETGALLLPSGFQGVDPWIRFGPNGELIYSCAGLGPRITGVYFSISLPSTNTGGLALARNLPIASAISQLKQRPNCKAENCPPQGLPFLDHPSFAVLKRGASFRIVACWSLFFVPEKKEPQEPLVEVAYSNGGVGWSEQTVGIGRLCAVGGDGSDVNGPISDRMAVTWLDDNTHQLKARTSTNGIRWNPPTVIGDATEATAAGSITDKVFLSPSSFIISLSNGLEAVAELRINDKSSVFVTDLPAQTRTFFGGAAHETFIAGTGACGRVVGMYMLDSPGVVPNDSPFRFTAWEADLPDPQLIFTSGNDLFGDNSFPSGIPGYHTLNEYMGADCSTDFGWVAWTDVRAGQQIWGAQIPLLKP